MPMNAILAVAAVVNVSAVGMIVRGGASARSTTFAGATLELDARNGQIGFLRGGDLPESTRSNSVHWIAATLRIAVVTNAAACAACSLNSGMITGSNPAPESASQMGAAGVDISGRPAQVAFISACAQAYGYTHDPAKLRATYVSYEARRGASQAQLASIGNSYDSTYQAISDLGSRKASYCSVKDGAELRADLKRYQSGYFEARAALPSEASDDWKKTRDSINCGARC
jgi:hypothetical protein